MTSERTQKLIDLVGGAIFGIRWGLVPIYLCMWASLVAYNIKLAQVTWEMLVNILELTEPQLLLMVINSVDMTLVANLVVLMTIGGYSTFVREFNMAALTNKPRWMNGIDSSTLKVKMSQTLVGITSVGLIKTFMSIAIIPQRQLWAEIAIHVTFLLSTVVLTVVAKHMQHHHPKPSIEHEPEVSHP